MEKLNIDYVIKYVLLGDSDVGKSCISNRYAKESFDSDYLPTLGVEFNSKLITVNEKVIKLQIWDTSGLDKYKSLIKTYLKTATIIIVYDLTNNKSFENVANYLELLKDLAPQPFKILVGNKCERKMKEEKLALNLEVFMRMKTICIS